MTYALVIAILVFTAGVFFYGRRSGYRDGYARGAVDQLKKDQEGYNYVATKEAGLPQSIDSSFGVREPGMWSKTSSPHPTVRLVGPTDDGTSQRDDN